MFLISRPKLFGQEDTARRKIQLEAVKIGSIRVELNHPIKICKTVCEIRSSSENIVSILLFFFLFRSVLLSSSELKIVRIITSD